MRRIADYRLIEPMGEGNHGRFYLAEPPPRLGIDDRVVALKVLDRHADEVEFRRIVNELKVFAAVRSPHLVTLYDAGHDRGAVYYSMRYHERGSLAAAAASLPAHGVVAAVAGAARGAHALHEVGVAHRDIKPANMLLDDGAARLSDLGLAQLIDTGLTSGGRGPIGAIAFMDPGVVCGERASRASDVWSLGASLHHALAGGSVYGPLPEGDLVQTLRHVLRTAPRVDADLPPALRDVISRCLAAERQDRFPTAADFADAVEVAVAQPATS